LLPEDFNLNGYLLTKKDELLPKFKYKSSSREILPGMYVNTQEVLSCNPSLTVY
jgi:hypothetical protein